jgi:RES domain-containing protein
VHVWRIARAVYDPLDGEGARRAGGRWNSAGLPAVYTAGTQSLAILEALIHLDPELLPRDYTLYRVEIPDDIQITTVETARLPPDWREPGHAACKTIGDLWLRAGATAVLRVPAAPLHDGDEYGYVINPRHGERERIVVKQREPFRFDLRLV